jgi:hypothetical protein
MSGNLLSLSEVKILETNQKGWQIPTQEDSICDQSIDPTRSINGPVDNDLICGICKFIIRDPVECSTCEYAFCSDCISQVIIEQGRCSNGCINPVVKKPHRKLRELIKELKLGCRYSILGCTHILTIEELKTHEDECSFIPVRCPAYEDC